MSFLSVSPIHVNLYHYRRQLVPLSCHRRSQSPANAVLDSSVAKSVRVARPTSGLDVELNLRNDLVHSSRAAERESVVARVSNEWPAEPTIAPPPRFRVGQRFEINRRVRYIVQRCFAFVLTTKQGWGVSVQEPGLLIQGSPVQYPKMRPRFQIRTEEALPPHLAPMALSVLWNRPH